MKRAFLNLLRGTRIDIIISKHHTYFEKRTDQPKIGVMYNKAMKHRVCRLITFCNLDFHPVMQKQKRFDYILL